MKVKINTNGIKLFIPVPYFCLHIIMAVLTSKRFVVWMNKAIGKGKKTAFQFPQLNKKDLQPLLKALSKHKGTRLVDTKLKDGTEVSVTL